MLSGKSERAAVVGDKHVVGGEARLAGIAPDQEIGTGGRFDRWQWQHGTVGGLLSTCSGPSSWRALG